MTGNARLTWQTHWIHLSIEFGLDLALLLYCHPRKRCRISSDTRISHSGLQQSAQAPGPGHTLGVRRILLSTLTSVASDLFNYALRLDNELSARPPRSVNRTENTNGLLTNRFNNLVTCVSQEQITPNFTAICNVASPRHTRNFNGIFTIAFE